MQFKKDVLACQRDSLLFRNVSHCRSCKGVNCKYLQSYQEEDIANLIEQGYKWF